MPMPMPISVLKHLVSLRLPILLLLLLLFLLSLSSAAATITATTTSISPDPEKLLLGTSGDEELSFFLSNGSFVQRPFFEVMNETGFYPRLHKFDVPHGAFVPREIQPMLYAMSQQDPPVYPVFVYNQWPQWAEYKTTWDEMEWATEQFVSEIETLSGYFSSMTGVVYVLLEPQHNTLSLLRESREFSIVLRDAILRLKEVAKQNEQLSLFVGVGVDLHYPFFVADTQREWLTMKNGSLYYIFDEVIDFVGLSVYRAEGIKSDPTVEELLLLNSYPSLPCYIVSVLRNWLFHLNVQMPSILFTYFEADTESDADYVIEQFYNSMMNISEQLLSAGMIGVVHDSFPENQEHTGLTVPLLGDYWLEETFALKRAAVAFFEWSRSEADQTRMRSFYNLTICPFPRTTDGEDLLLFGENQLEYGWEIRRNSSVASMLPYGELRLSAPAVSDTAIWAWLGINGTLVFYFTGYPLSDDYPMDTEHYKQLQFRIWPLSNAPSLSMVLSGGKEIDINNKKYLELFNNSDIVPVEKLVAFKWHRFTIDLSDMQVGDSLNLGSIFFRGGSKYIRFFMDDVKLISGATTLMTHSLWLVVVSMVLGFLVVQLLWL